MREGDRRSSDTYFGRLGVIVRVHVSGPHFIFPELCACCCELADRQLAVAASKSTGKRVIRTRTNAWDIPYCQTCLKHAKVYDEATASGCAQAVLSIVVLGAAWYSAGLFLGGALGLLMLVGTALLTNHLTSNAQQIQRPTCATISRSVKYVEWHGTVHELSMASRDYALAFMLANKKKLCESLG